jgi:hypothetical protein
VVAANVAVWDYVQDDGYIAFNYAHHLASTGAPTYNVGHHDRFGYSNPLYIALLAVGRIVSRNTIPLEAISRVIATIAFGAIFFIVFNSFPHGILKGRLRSFMAWVFLTIVFAMFPYALPNFFSGLETALFSLLIFLLLSALLRNPPNDIQFLLALSIALTLRIDAFFLLIPIIIYYLISHGVISMSRRARNIALVLFVVLVFYGIHIAMTRAVVPLSYGHKRQPFSVSVFLDYVFFSAMAFLPCAAILLDRDVRVRRFLALSGLYLCYVGFFYAFFEHWHFERYVFPFVFSIFALALSLFFRTWKPSDWKCIPLFGTYAFFVFLPGTLDGFSWVSGYRVAMMNAESIADALRQSGVAEEHRCFASYDAGLVAFKSQWRIVDLLGLTTPEVTAGNIGTVVGTLNPTVVIVTSLEDVPPERLELYSRYQSEPSPLPKRYRYVNRLVLSNRYWWPDVNYMYYIYVNSNAEDALVRQLRNINIDIDREMKHQKLIFKAIDRISMHASLGEGRCARG